MSAIHYRAAIDIGGTFTDFVLQGDDGSTLTHKTSSTPDDYGRAIVDGLQAMAARHGFAPDAVSEVIHGTTVATNTILEGKGAATALVTTQGFRDVLELRRVRIAELYNLGYTRPAPLVPRRHRFEVDERLNHRGEVERPLTDTAIDRVLDEVRASGATALAICLLHSYANPAHEQRIEARARAVLPRGTFICASYRVLPEIKEYERTSTTVINAYIGPAILRYCQRLRAALDGAGFRAPIRIMQSSGGVLSLEEVLEIPAYIVESGPAAGVIGSAIAGARWGEPNLLTVDMGGTTAKAALVEEGRVGRTNEYEVGAGINISSRLVKGGGHALKLPVIDISEIGAGGGSIARVSAHGTLSVGPDSAGAMPGPACYGQGGESATLTDAMVTLGYVNPRYLVGGALALQGDRARAAIESQVAVPLRMPLLEAAHGVYVLAATTMTRAVKAVSTFRGRDPRDFTLFAFGGNGPLMAVEIAQALDIGKVICPRFAGLYSAVGLLNAAIEREVSQTWLRPLRELTVAALDGRFATMEARVREMYRGYAAQAQLQVRRWADLRFHGQAYELTVPVPEVGPDLIAVIRDAFVAEHRRTYGHGDAADAIDLVNLRVSAGLPMPAFVHAPLATSHAEAATRDAYFGAAWGVLPTTVVARDALATGLAGPAIVEEVDTTVLVPPGWRATLGPDSSIVMQRETA